MPKLSEQNLRLRCFLVSIYKKTTALINKDQYGGKKESSNEALIKRGIFRQPLIFIVEDFG